MWQQSPPVKSGALAANCLKATAFLVELKGLTCPRSAGARMTITLQCLVKPCFLVQSKAIMSHVSV